jgi:hypothetical protein
MISSQDLISPLERKVLLVASYSYGVVSYRMPHATATTSCSRLSVMLTVWSSNHFRFIQSSILRLQQRHLVAKRGESGPQIAAEFCLISISVIPQGIFNMP